MQRRPYSRWQLASKWLWYYITASNGRGHGIHSPFVYSFISELLMDNRRFPSFNRIEDLRRELKKDQTKLTVADFGAGSQISKGQQRSVASIAKHAAKRPRLAQLLFRSVQYFQPAAVLELGTSLGISAAYLAAANPSIPVITLEGAAELGKAAENNFKTLGLENITVMHGRFDERLPEVLPSLPRPTLVYIDGNHQQAPTIAYFKLLKDELGKDAILIFDDIHWSPGMETAWKIIRKDPAVTCSIDLFSVGFIFMRSEIKLPLHFTIRY